MGVDNGPVAMIPMIQQRRRRTQQYGEEHTKDDGHQPHCCDCNLPLPILLTPLPKASS